MTTVKKTKDVSGTTPEGSAAPQSQHAGEQDASSKRPLWSRQINRVDCSIWKHDQNGETRYTVAITRSYQERASKQWKRSSYFDEADLQDIRLLCDEAQERLLSLKGMTRSVGED